MLRRLSIVVVCLIFCSALRAEEITLFNGKDLAGWKHAGPGGFTVADGELHTDAGMGLLWYSEKEFSDFTLTLEFKVSRKEDNSGIFVRFPDPGNDPWVAVKEGHEIQICDTETGKQTGAIYNFQNSTELATKPVGEWNQYEITVVGKKYTVKLNGKVVNEYTTEKPLKKGYVGLQNHDPKSKVSFRNVKVKEAEKQVSLAAPQAVDKSRVAGMVGKYYQDVKSLDDIAKAKEPFYSRVDERVNFRVTKGQFYKTKLATDFGAVWTGYMRVEKAGRYNLAMRSDDGSRLYIGDQLIINIPKPSPEEVMKNKTASVKLEKGDYPVKVEYYNLGGGAGIVLSWKLPGAEKMDNIPAENFFHDRAQEKVDWDQAAWNKTRWSYREWAQKYGNAWDKMDYGPFLTASVELAENNAALKGITIHLGDNDEATMVFDTDLLRMAGGWTGGFLELHGVVFDGAHGVNPTPDGEILWIAPRLPGAACGSELDKMAQDPRPKPYGPLAHEWAKYKGLYLNGKRMTLHYTVGDTDVLDSPWAKAVGDQVVLTRTIKLSPSDQPLTILIDKPNEDSGMVVMTSGEVRSGTIKDNRYVTFPPRKEATTYRLAFSKTSAVKPDDLKTIVAEKEDIDALTQAGPMRWDKPVVTKGEVSKATTQPYVLDTITVPEENPWHSWMRFGGLDFFSDGRAAISTWSGDVWIVSGIDDKLEKLTWKRYATGLFQSLGLKIVDDTVYVLGRDQITRLKDTNNDGEADLYECFNNDCQVSKSFHEFAFDLQTDSKGNFYYVKAGPVNPGGRGWQEITDNNGSMLRVSKDGSKFEVFAAGLRAPNGMSIGPNDEITCGDNEGTWTPACRISMVKQGMMLGVPDLAHKTPPPTTYDKPICWLPHGDVDNSSGGQVWVTSDKWGSFQNRLLHTSYGTCSLFLVMYEYVDGQIQGGVVKFGNLPFITGICRPRFNPVDKQLYIAGLRGWQTTATKDAGLQRVRYTGAKVTMPTEMHFTHEGVNLTFTEPVDPALAGDASNYSVEQWNLHWTNDYGSAEYSLVDPKEKAHDPVEVQKATVSADGKSVFLKLDEVVPVMQMKIQMKIKSADGRPMDYAIYNTINTVPKSGSGTAKTPATAASAR